LQTVALDGRRFTLREGETIRSEESYKYSISDFTRLAAEASLRSSAVWTDAAGVFSVHYLEPA
jgi:uncharacterized SAM-dependent methyltransferase